MRNKYLKKTIAVFAAATIAFSSFPTTVGAEMDLLTAGDEITSQIDEFSEELIGEVSSEVDASSPEITDVAIREEGLVLYAGDIVHITAKIKDVNPMEMIQVSLGLADNTQSWDILFTYDDNTDELEAYWTLGEDSPIGEYRINFIKVSNIYHNSACIEQPAGSFYYAGVIPEPSAAPTPEPTAIPTSEPSAAPTPEPTVTPTPESTVTPTPEPTATPTPTPVEMPVVAVSNTTEGVHVSWNAVEGAASYRLFYRVKGATTWDIAADVDGSGFDVIGLNSGTEYSFTVRCMDAEGNYNSKISPSKSIKYVAPPIIKSLDLTRTGVTVKWNNVSGASKYRVFYKIKGASSWTKTGDTAATSYTVDQLQSGKSYLFNVRCVNAAGTSYMSAMDPNGLSKWFVKAPVVSSVSNTTTGVKVTWEKSSGASGYRVFYRVKDTATWKTAGDVSSASNSYNVTKLKSGVEYSFTVRSLNTSGNTNSQFAQSKHIRYLAPPVISSMTLTRTGITVNWGAVAGASKYRVFYKISGASNWTTAGDTTSKSFTVDKLTSGKTYYFTVRCINAAGSSYTSEYDAAGKSKWFVQAPSVTNLSSTTSSVNVTWAAKKGASKYRIFYKEPGNSWKTAATTTGTNYTVKGLISGRTYVFAVRAMNAAGTSYTSAMGLTSKPIECKVLPTPTPTPIPAPTENPSSQITTPVYVGSMVWISSTGSKYHSRSSCSNMRRPSQITLSQAIAWGYTPCKKCY